MASFLLLPAIPFALNYHFVNSPVWDVVQSPYAGDSLGVALARIDELEAEARASRAHARELYHEIDAAIKQLTGPGWPDQRAVLQMRYLDGCRWVEIAEMLFGGDSDDFDERQDSFLRRVHKIHGAALGKLSNIVPLDVGQEIT